ncbi:tRNA pseudouridine(13) synthase TruD [Methanobacterium alkalithermotolerans]|uniref:Probable tRNA pseudouridine synthase D n=1 Tax=Methanobacterium alkalithermotolerans TaxID=2731220 RepID=A0A8T8K6R8_9EURY|nr:tRNA pseudouridine(13) synthase TruD [Methanobacterium alkalithermotolerans]QUH23512.1 tRNA pseudouridine(13) synthase TruD [Methanobacterium alkalithermotolerans]
MLNAETFITPTKGTGGTIRVEYEDFYVEEIPETIPTGEGPNTWMWIEKKGRTTLDVVLDIARDLKLSRKRMGFAGMKDKKAVTRQWLGISNFESKDLEPILDKYHHVKFIKVTQNQKKLRMGQLLGNKFRILIRNIENPDESAFEAQKVLKKLEEVGTPNYYGWQRFGKPRSNTHLVGKALTKNSLKKTVGAYIGNPYDDEPEHIKAARAAYDDGNLEKSFELMPTGMRYERMMLRTLLKEEKKKQTLDEESYRKALYSLPKPLSRMFIHAYQSFLFNKAVSKRSALGINQYHEGDIIIDNDEHLIHDGSPEDIQEQMDNFQAHPTAPLFGSKVPLAGGKLGEMEQEVLDEEGLSLDDFKCPKMPKLGSHGLRRAIRFKIWDVSATATPEGILTEFSIPKGCYATAVLREIMKTEAV